MTFGKIMEIFWTLEEKSETTQNLELSQTINNELLELQRGVAQLASAQRSGR